MKRLAIAMKIATVIATETDAIALQTKLSLKQYLVVQLNIEALAGDISPAICMFEKIKNRIEKKEQRKSKIKEESKKMERKNKNEK